jgi:predicted homoserine dehydrogenase-like protein
VIDGAGGSTVYALNDLYTTAQAENVVPLGLLTGAKLLRDVPTDAAITYDMVEILTGSTLYHLRAMQDSGAAGSFGRGVQPAPERPQVTRLAS